LGVATTANGFQEADGILGVGPVGLTAGSLAVANGTRTRTQVPTIIDSLFAAGKIPAPILGVSFVPATVAEAANGRVTFGGVDSTSFEGELTWMPVTKTLPASAYWGTNLTIKTGGSTIQDNLAGIMDTGSTLILVSSTTFAAYMKVNPTARLDSTGTGLLEFPESAASTIPDMTFDFGGKFTATLKAEDQLLPEAQNTLFGGKPGFRYGYVSNLGSASGVGLDFIVGQKFLEKFYTAYNTANQTIGIARSTRTTSNGNITSGAGEKTQGKSGNGKDGSGTGTNSLPTGIVVFPGKNQAQVGGAHASFVISGLMGVMAGAAGLIML